MQGGGSVQAMSRRRYARAAVLTVSLCALWATSARANTPMRYSGPYQLSGSFQGLSVKGSGTLILRVDARSGALSCTLSGSATQRGQQTYQGVVVQMSGRSTMRSTACSGRVDPAGGRVEGAVTIREQGQVTMTARVPDEEGRLQNKTQTEPGGQTITVRLTGRLDAAAGHGSLVDQQRNAWTWRVRRSPDGASGGATPAPGAQQRQGGSPRPGPTAAPPKPAGTAPDRAAAHKPPPVAAGPGADRPAPPGAPVTPRPSVQPTQPQAAAQPGAPLSTKQAAQVEEAARKGERLASVLDKIQQPEARKEATQRFVDTRRAEVDAGLRKADKQLKKASAEKSTTGALQQVIETAVDKAKGPLTEKAAEKVDGVLARGWGWLKGKFGGEAKAPSGPGPVSSAVKVLGKVQDIGEKVGEVVKVKQSIDKLTEQVKKGEISEDRGKVLKGGTLLGKALAKVAGYIPIFGSTASKVTDETFGVALKAGNKLARHYTTTDCCVRDPLAECCH